MLHTETAYPVPFQLERSDSPHRYDLRNRSDEPLDGLTLTHLGTGYAPPLRIRRLDPGQALGIAVFGGAPEDAGVVVVRWRRPDRQEYLWRVAL
ncbi:MULTISPECIES: hypothetical protein [unclassified Curtobacterium]|uniref:hypothetical protein n=1 Tax=unclassified Curtobacterium TaxID=257496 RepID=UPI000DA927FA|nr:MULTISPECIES: hypothetical protein [unclassified Curtobacterium]PZE25316.1 hypothetical protein DEI86_10850 [Curtobacterium sp. MCBD17_028]PZE75325.1 hypothetical protein DEI82_08230 [Curtobacterium sp. MCBD17_019]WIB62834.1 hypothetical protein DEI94_11760 [Curtobacterium sp. MCBD17_040]WIE53831.1 hypothetical protein DEI88_011910 [Curtobacterium sp. MCBD17_003]